jgi:alpha-glucosidase/alpha-D-xyloside xylohydrolase
MRPAHPLGFKFICRTAFCTLFVFPTVCLADDAAIRVASAPRELAVSSISERTLRIDLSPLDNEGHPFPSPPTAVFVPYDAVERLRVRELPAPREIDAGSLHVSIKPQPLEITVTRADGSTVQELSFDLNDGSIIFRTPAPVFGLGEGRQQFDRRGFYYDFINGQGQLYRTHGATIPVPFLIGADGWAMFIHNPPMPDGNLRGAAATRDANIPWGRFDIRGEHAGPPPPPAPRNVTTNVTAPAELPTRGRFIPRPDTVARTPIHIFIVNVENPTDAMAEYVRLTGHPAMPPKWAMGYMQSHRSLAGPAEPIDVAKTLRDHQLPCDALIYLGSGYTNDKQGQSGWNTGHGSLTFNPRIFDKPQEMIDQLHAMHYKVILHKNAAPAGLFGTSVDEPSDSPLHISNYWATHTPLMKMGIDAWWPDDGDELPIESRLARLRLYYEGPLKDRPNERPWSLDRNGYAGAARFGAWIWSGDVQSRWTTLANHVPIGLNFSMSVSPWWGTDIGGFAASDEYTGELYVRWFEFAAFTPLFRSHGRNWHLHTPFGWNTGETGPVESEPPPPSTELHNAAVEPICKKYLELRYRLLPYNYTIAREACDTGLPMMRTLWLHYAEDAESVKLGDEYLWGRDILVAPVVEKGATTRRVYLPKGQWYDWWDDAPAAPTSGGQWITRPVDLGTLPMFARAGAIVPLDPVRQYTAQAVDEPTTIRVYPGGDGSFTLYDDDGHTLGYQNGSDQHEAWIQFQWNDAARRLTIARGARMKQWPDRAMRVFNAELVGQSSKTSRVEFVGERIDVQF